MNPLRRLAVGAVGRNPALVAAVSLSLGILVGTYAGHRIETWYLLVFAAIGCVAAFIGFAKTNIGWTTFGIAVLLFCIGMHRCLEAWQAGIDVELPTEYTRIEATLKETLASRGGVRTVLLEKGHYGSPPTALPGYGRLIIRQEDLQCKAGDRLAFSGRIRRPRNRGNPGEFDWELHCRNNGIYWLASLRPKTQIVVVNHGPLYSPRSMLFSFRNKINEFLDSAPMYIIRENHRENVRGMLKAVVIGDLSEVSPVLYKNFADSGLAHTLSASGLHVGMVALLATSMAAMASWMFPGILLWIPLKKLAAALSIPAMVSYCVIVGGRVPAIRATVMGLMIGGAFLFERKWQSFNALAFAAVLVLFVYPLSLFSPSFQLSFGAVAGIIIALQRFRTDLDGDSASVSPSLAKFGRHSPEDTLSRIWAALKNKAFLIVIVCLGAVIGTMPIMWFFFRSFPVYTLLANLVANSFMTGALGFGLLASMLSIISDRLGNVALMPADICAFFVVKTAEVFAGLPFSVFRKAHPDSIQLLLTTVSAAAALLFIGRVWKKRFRLLIIVFCLSTGLLFARDFFAHSNQDVEVYFLNVGKGDSIFLRSPSSQGVLIDGGIATEYFDAGARIVAPFLLWAGVNRLQAIIMSHPDTDHIGGMVSVVDCVAVDKILWNPVQANSLHLDRILMAAKEKTIPVECVSRDSTVLTFGGARLRFLNAPVTMGKDARESARINNASVVVRLDHGETSFLFTGDLEREGEDELLSAGLPLKADVLKIGHHGSKNSTSLDFLKAVAPRIAVISADYPPTVGLPNEEILHRLASFGIQVYWTGRDGAVTIVSNGRSLSVRHGIKSSK